MSKILVADDEVDLEMLIKQKFRKQIRENKYEFLFSLNGSDALEKLQQHPDVDMVLTDINMPEVDGLTLLTRLPQVSPLVKAVMVSAYGDMENIRTAMNRGAFDFVCKPVNFQDLELTIEKTLQHVAQIKETLQAIKENNILRMYVDENVLQFMNRKEYESSLMANETIEATVAFIDICSFTSITENEPANKVVHLLNKYFDVMVKEIIAQKGHVDKFIGDAIMAVFRGEYHLDRAIEASLAVRSKIENLPTEENQIEFSPKVSIGIHRGEMVSGNIGSANLKRLDYTVIGDVVNTAQRLQTAAEEGQILIDESSYEQVKEFFSCTRVGEIILKNKSNPLVAYEVLN
ncbi:MAG TPA: adenylate/guanylate cyclase domain-containing protein [Flavisolibacter sp.]|nr:adenylate/guanylate cyclase domain-containing protein [Flavisolibacter sp.]